MRRQSAADATVFVAIVGELSNLPVLPQVKPAHLLDALIRRRKPQKYFLPILWCSLNRLPLRHSPCCFGCARGCKCLHHVACFAPVISVALDQVEGYCAADAGPVLRVVGLRFVTQLLMQ